MQNWKCMYVTIFIDYGVLNIYVYQYFNYCVIFHWVDFIQSIILILDIYTFSRLES